MKAIVVERRGGSDQLVSKQVPDPAPPHGHDLLVRVKACSVNPIDIKVRSGIYDDYPDYFDHVPAKDQIIGFDGAGIVEATGPHVQNFKAGDHVYYSGSPTRPGSNAELQLVDARSVGHKPKTLSWTQAAALPLTYVTAYEALLERMEIRVGEQAGVLIVNGAGGVGSVATQIAREILRLPVVITTTSRDETTAFSQTMGATHTVNHREDITAQVKALNVPPSTPLKYVFITHSTTPYLHPAAALCAPFGKVCSIVQTKEMSAMYGTKPWYGVDMESHGRMLEELARMIDEGRIKGTMQREGVDVEGPGELFA
ncbi:MAG: hypothetical protein Q9162_002192 [Coniocarpon cinnabarinum]